MHLLGITFILYELNPFINKIADNFFRLLKRACFVVVVVFVIVHFWGGRRGGLVVNAQDSRWPGHCVVLLGKALYSHSASPPPRSINGYQEIVRET